VLHIRFYDACCGIGGFTFALQNSGYQCVGACEIDKYARHVYESHFGEISDRDIKLLDIKNMPDFDLLTAGFPCQPFSTAGKCEGWNDCRSDVFPEIIRIIQQKHPKYVLLENTSGLLNHDNGATFWKVLRALWQNGYDAQWQIIDSQHFTPQHRNRLYIVASIREECTRPIFPLPYFNGTNTQAAKKVKGSKSTCLKKTGKKSNQKKTSPRRNYNGEHWFLNMTFMNSQMKNRLRLRNVTPTITTTPSTDFAIIQNGLARSITPTECEKLQGFPKNWTASLVSDTRRCNLIGNAVTIPVVQQIGMALKEAVTFA